MSEDKKKYIYYIYDMVSKKSSGSDPVLQKIRKIIYENADYDVNRACICYSLFSGVKLQTFESYIRDQKLIELLS